MKIKKYLCHLKKYASWQYWKAIFNQREIIEDIEVIRYIKDRKSFSRDKNKVKPSAFEDNRRPRELSVYQNKLNKNEMVEILVKNILIKI